MTDHAAWRARYEQYKAELRTLQGRLGNEMWKLAAIPYERRTAEMLAAWERMDAAYSREHDAIEKKYADLWEEVGG